MAAGILSVGWAQAWRRALAGLTLGVGLLGALPAGAETFTLATVPALAEPLRQLAPRFKAATRHDYRLQPSSAAGAMEAIATNRTLALVVLDDPALAETALANTVLTEGSTLATDRLVLAMLSTQARAIRLTRGAAIGDLLEGGALGLVDASRNGLGKRSDEALAWLGGVDPLIIPMVRYEHSGDAATALIRQQVVAAILPASQLGPLPTVEAAGTFPAAAHAPLAYVAYPVAGRAPQAVAAFLAFLADPQTKLVLQQSGLSVP